MPDLHMSPAMESPRRLTSIQRRSLIAAWLGWAFDGLDGFLYVMVGVPFVAQLLGKPINDPEVATKASIIQAAFLVGWAVGGAVFGRLGDRLGRSRTLTLTVLTYALFTGASALATQWWHLLIFRFIAALGIGGEWAAGSALVSETLGERHKAWASATLQSGYMVGCIAAALTSGWMSHLDPRWVFLVGVLPALLTVWIRAAVPEPEAWAKQAAHAKPPPVSALFSPQLARTTILTILLTGIALTTVWAFLFFLGQAVRAIPEVKAMDRPAADKLIANITVFYLCINIVGNYFATYLAKLVGDRAAFALLFAASLACFLIGFGSPLSVERVWWVAGSCAFFALGLFGLFPLYVPPLFPTMVRTLGAGVTYNAGRLISAAGTLGAGWLSAHAGGPAAALWWIGLLYIPGIAVALVAPRPALGD